MEERNLYHLQEEMNYDLWDMSIEVGIIYVRWLESYYKVLKLILQMWCLWTYVKV